MSLWAALVALPAAPVIELLRQEAPVPAANISMAAEASYRAGRIFDSGRYFSDAALAASNIDPTSRSTALHGVSLGALVDEALTEMPASPQNWVRRAAIQLAAGDIRGARTSLDTSLLIGRFVPGLTGPRLRVMLQLLKRSPDPSLKAAIVDQMRIAARTEPSLLARIANGGMSEGIAQAALASDFTLYQAYIKALIELRAADKSASAKASR